MEDREVVADQETSYDLIHALDIAFKIAGLRPRMSPDNSVDESNDVEFDSRALRQTI